MGREKPRRGYGYGRCKYPPSFEFFCGAWPIILSRLLMYNTIEEWLILAYALFVEKLIPGDTH
jgi:hypothetical protein